MIVPTADQIAPALRKPGVPADHPLEVLAVDSAVEFALEDVVQKGMAGVVALRRRRAARPITALELDQAQRAMERTGREGEALVNARLMTTQNPGGNFAFAWEASENAVASYDFRCISEGGIMGDGQMKIDVKSTRGPFSTNFHLSLAEAIDAATSEIPHHVWRISGLSDDAADLHKSEDIREFASGLVTAHNGAMPGNVQADSFSIPVDTPGLIWGAVERLDRLDPDED